MGTQWNPSLQQRSITTGGMPVNSQPESWAPGKTRERWNRFLRCWTTSILRFGKQQLLPWEVWEIHERLSHSLLVSLPIHPERSVGMQPLPWETWEIDERLNPS